VTSGFATASTRINARINWTEAVTNETSDGGTSRFDRRVKRKNEISQDERFQRVWGSDETGERWREYVAAKEDQLTVRRHDVFIPQRSKPIR